MNIKKIMIPAIGVVTVITGALLFKNNAKTASSVAKIATEIIKEPQITYGGIPLSKLNEIAKKVYHGIKVTIDKYGLLVFHYTSNSGKTIFRPRIDINELGKLVNLGGHYPNQWWSPADEFVKRVNEVFFFKK